MSIDLVIPEVGESILEVQLLAWQKKVGDEVAKDEELIGVESEKATVPISAPVAGRITEIRKKDGEFAKVGDVIGTLEPLEKPASDGSHRPSQRAVEKTAKLAQASVAQPSKEVEATWEQPEVRAEAPKRLPKTASGAAAANEAKVTAKPERISTDRSKDSANESPKEEEPDETVSKDGDAETPLSTSNSHDSTRPQRRVRMTLLRQTIAKRLVDAHRTAALVTTFNEVDMTDVIALRKSFGEAFQADFDIKLGFMSFFLKAVVDALSRFPEVNACIEGKDIIYHDYADIGVAIGAGKGLVVPVLRDCANLSFAQIERQISDFSKRAGEGKLKPNELQGGTFTISNGGVFGSLLSTPIVNPPQSGVLGLHAIQERPIALRGQVVIRPMMYIALTYDHRIVDGREAIGFLRRVKEVIETPSRILMGV